MFSLWRKSLKAVHTEKPPDISGSNTDFALELFRTLDKDKRDGNIFFSPLSLSCSLAMAYLGAKGDTAAQMAQVLSFGSAEDIHADFKKLNKIILSESGSCTVKLASRLYGETTFNFRSEFLEAVKDYYKSELKAVDFIGAPEACRAEINAWVEEQTQKKIKDLLQPGAITALTSLAVVNAIYFKGRWKHLFSSDETTEADFQVHQYDTRKVQMMYIEKKLPYAHISQYHLDILELPYKDEEFSMVILLPEKSTGFDPLQKLQSILTQKKLNKWTSRRNMSTRSKVSASIPKFKLEDSYNLNVPLAKMGMTDVFCDKKADLSGMSVEEGLYLSTVTHRAIVDVNETGTEAVAASQMMYKTYGLFDHTIPFTADHPFLFFIRHNSTNSILFLGRFSSP